MKNLLFATSNLNKAEELKKLTADMDVKILTLHDFPNLSSPEETGKTFKENAAIKARAAAKATGHWALADDSGLAVKALNGAPGIYSARYSGENATAESNNEKLLKAMEKLLRENARQCFAPCWLWFCQMVRNTMPKGL